MSTPNLTDPQDYYVDGLSRITSVIVKQSSSDSGNYIYRGEPEHEEKPYCGKVSSTLYRINPQDFDTGKFSLKQVQERTLTDIKRYLVAYENKQDFEIWTDLQHYGSKTNLIDFSSDYHIALFFACNGSHDKDGRVILLKTTDEINKKYSIRRPQSPQHRVIAQKSIFAQPPNGYLDFEDIAIIPVPANLKQWILIHLRKFQDISTQSIFNDLHGYVRQQQLRLSPEAINPRVNARVIMEEISDRAPLDEERKHKLNTAIENYTSGLQYTPYNARLYAQLANCYFQLDDIIRAIETLSKSIWLTPDYDFAYLIRALCYAIQGDYEHSMTDFKTIIDFDSDLAAEAYYYRGIEMLHLQNWKAAKSDLIAATAKGKNIRIQFAENYKSISEYNQQFGVKLPQDIAAMLQPVQALLM